MVKLYIAVGLIALWMLVGGIAHMIAPEVFLPIVPDYFPELLVIYASGLVEIVIGLAVLWPRTRALAGLAFAALCLGFLPLHLWDFFRPDPIFEPWLAASARIVWQGVLIGVGLYVYRYAGRKQI